MPLNRFGDTIKVACPNPFCRTVNHWTPNPESLGSAEAMLCRRCGRLIVLPKPQPK
jgi:hypothetical protein